MDRLSVKVNMDQSFKRLDKKNLDKRNVILWLVNLCISFIFWITKDMNCLPIIMLIGYEIVIFGFLAIKKKLKLWALLIPVSTVLIPTEYVFYADEETTKWLKVIFPVIAISLGILMWLLYIHSNKRNSYWVVDLVIIIICVIGIFGQLTQINSSFYQSKVKQESIVTEKMIVESSRPFSTVYYITIEADDETKIELSIPKKMYKKLSEGTSVQLTIYTGAFGIKYSKNVQQEIDSFLN